MIYLIILFKILFWLAVILITIGAIGFALLFIEEVMKRQNKDEK